MGDAEVRAGRDRHPVTAPSAGRQGGWGVGDGWLPGRLRQRSHRRPVAVRHHEHRHAHRPGQGLGRSTIEGGHRISDNVLELLRGYESNGTPCALATVVRTEPPTSARPGDKAIITADGRLRGWIGGSCSEPVVRREALRALAEGTPQLVKIVGSPPRDEVAGTPVGMKQTRRRGELTVATTCPSGGSLDVFIEPHMPRPLLLVFGDSPAARTLIQMGSLAGFRTCAVHPGARPEDF